MECDLLEMCGFFKKYEKTDELACKGFIRQYCKGDKMKECKRKEHRRTTGTPPPDDMLPNGKMLK